MIKYLIFLIFIVSSTSQEVYKLSNNCQGEFKELGELWIRKSREIANREGILNMQSNDEFIPSQCKSEIVQYKIEFPEKSLTYMTSIK